MGGFVYVKKKNNEDAATLQKRIGPSLRAFGTKGMPLRHRIERDEFVIHVFDKVSVRAENCLEFDHGDFIIATGTPIYSKQLGRSALRRLYENFDPERIDFRHFYGHFGVLIRKDERLYAFNDYNGVYCLYQNGDSSLISNSLLAVVASLDDLQFDRQAVYEYLTFEATLGDQSIVRQVSKLPGDRIHRLGLGRRTYPKNITLSTFDSHRNMNALLDDTSDLLHNYFDTLAEIFGNQQSIGLTGGYGSRLTLACMRSVKVSPRVYVQGPKDSDDVQVASAIAEGEDFALDHREEESRSRHRHDDYADRVRTTFSRLDGLPPSGLFSDFRMLAQGRRSRKRSSDLRIYAIGGEAYRDFWHIGEQEYNIEDVLRAKFARTEFSKFSDTFDKDQFFSAIVAKCKRNLGIDRDRFTWEEIELANAKWMLSNQISGFITNQNDCGYALVPFSEPSLLFASAKVPVSYKHRGRFESALITMIDPALASYRSNYGYAFDQKPGVIASCLEKLKKGTPFALRPLLHRLLGRSRKRPPLPFYLSAEFVADLVPDGLDRMEEFVHSKAAGQEWLLGRSLSLELLASNDLAHGFGEISKVDTDNEAAA